MFCIIKKMYVVIACMCNAMLTNLKGVVVLVDILAKVDCILA